jgi:hypothetical protein
VAQYKKKYNNKINKTLKKILKTFFKKGVTPLVGLGWLNHPHGPRGWFGHPQGPKLIFLFFFSLFLFGHWGWPNHQIFKFY